MTGGWFTLTELQERLNRDDRKALGRAVRKEEIPMTRFGNDYMIREAAWLERLKANETIGPAGKVRSVH